jgi:hypothetical protein
MDIERFRVLVSAFGSDPRRWPAAERPAALALLASAAEAQKLAAEAQMLDAVLEHASPVTAPEMNAAAIARRIARQAPRPNGIRQRSSGWRVRIGWPPVALLAAASIAGFVAGWAGNGVADAEPGSSAQPTLIDVLFGSLEGEDAEW